MRPSGTARWPLLAATEAQWFDRHGPMPPLATIESVTDGSRAAVLMQHPVRRTIVALARSPISATEIAGRLGLPRQRVNYHVRKLERARFLRPAERRVRRMRPAHLVAPVDPSPQRPGHRHRCDDNQTEHDTAHDQHVAHRPRVPLAGRPPPGRVQERTAVIGTGAG